MTVIEDIVTERIAGRSRYESAKEVRDEAQVIMDQEKAAYAEVLRKRREDGLEAEKELASLGVVGRPAGKRTRKKAAKPEPVAGDAKEAKA